MKQHALLSLALILLCQEGSGPGGALELGSVDSLGKRFGIGGHMTLDLELLGWMKAKVGGVELEPVAIFLSSPTMKDKLVDEWPINGRALVSNSLEDLMIKVIHDIKALTLALSAVGLNQEIYEIGVNVIPVAHLDCNILAKYAVKNLKGTDEVRSLAMDAGGKSDGLEDLSVA